MELKQESDQADKAAMTAIMVKFDSKTESSHRVMNRVHRLVSQSRSSISQGELVKSHVKKSGIVQGIVMSCHA
jgi:hypothetical protein